MTHALSVAPAQRIHQGQTARAGKTPIQYENPTPDDPAVLGCCPKTLYVLWDKYFNGIGEDQSQQRNSLVAREG